MSSEHDRSGDIVWRKDVVSGNRYPGIQSRRRQACVQWLDGDSFNHWSSTDFGLTPNQ